jgi:hypothetical protein
MVVLAQIHHDAGPRGFLSCIKMNKTRKVASGELHVDTFLKFPDRLHDSICPKQFVPVEGKRVITHLALLLICMVG